MKTKFKDLIKEVEIFNKIYHNTAYELSNKDEDDILEMAREQYIMQSDGVDFAHERVWNILKDISYF